MKIANCPNCGGADLYTTAAATPANGMMGPSLLPKLSMGKFNVVVCEDCGLARLFARRVDIEALKANGAWKRVRVSAPLGLNQP
jgi:predicted nucleic-acid-binding Zn-ribbon protein